MNGNRIVGVQALLRVRCGHLGSISCAGGVFLFPVVLRALGMRREFGIVCSRVGRHSSGGWRNGSSLIRCHDVERREDTQGDQKRLIELDDE